MLITAQAANAAVDFVALNRVATLAETMLRYGNLRNGKVRKTGRAHCRSRRRTITWRGRDGQERRDPQACASFTEFWKVCKNCNCAPQGQVILLPPVRGQTPWPHPNTRSFTVGGKFAGMCRHPPSWVEAYRPLNRDFWVNRASRCFTVKLRLSAGAALKSCPGARDQARARLPNKAAAP